MAYSFTEKKRIRKDFGKLPGVLSVPYLLSIQIDSYQKFLQQEAAGTERTEMGLHAAFRSVFPIVSYSGNAALEYVSYRLGDPVFDVKECQLRGLTYAAPLRVLVRLMIYDKEAPGPKKKVKDIREQEVYLGEMPLMTDHGTFVINGTERVIVSQLHRSPGVFFDHDKGKTHSSRQAACSPRASFLIAARGSTSSSTRRTSVFVRIDRRRKLPVSIILRALELHERADPRHVLREERVQARRRTDSAQARAGAAARRDRELRHQDRPQDARRERSPHHDAATCASSRRRRSKSSTCPMDYLEGKILAHDVVDKSTGEVIVERERRAHDGVASRSSIAAGIKKIETLFVNDLDRGAFISNTLRIDSTDEQARGARRDLPDDAPRRAADEGGRREPVPEPVLQSRSATTSRPSAA